MRYLLRVFLALDQLVNALAFGYSDETISYRAALASQNGQAWGCVLCKVVEWFMPDHCNLQKVSKAEKLSRGGTYAADHGIPLEEYYHRV
jgi:hypothetical protein